MNKRLEELLERVSRWPERAQEDAVLALKDIEERVVWESKLSADDRTKLLALRQTIQDSISRGGSYTEEEVEASVSAALDAWEQKRKGA